MAANPAMMIRIAANLTELKQNILEGKNQIEATTAAMQKLATSLNGDRLIQQAHNITAAIDSVGGVSKLTSAEINKMSGPLQQAIEKMQAMGKDVPPAMQHLASTMAQVRDATQSAAAAAGKAAEDAAKGPIGQFELMGVSAEDLKGRLENAFRSPEGMIHEFGSLLQTAATNPMLVAATVAAGLAGAEYELGKTLFEMAEHAAASGAAIRDLSLKTSTSAESISTLRAAVKAAGGDVEGFSNAMFMLQNRMEANRDKVEAAFATLHVGMAQFQSLAPDEQILALSDAFRALPEGTNRAALAVELFGKSGKENLALLMKPLTELREQSKALGLEWSTSEVMAAEDFEARMSLLDQTFERMKDRIGSAMLPALNSLLKSFESVNGPLSDISDLSTLAADAVGDFSSGAAAAIHALMIAAGPELETFRLLMDMSGHAHTTAPKPQGDPLADSYLKATEWTRNYAKALTDLTAASVVLTPAIENIVRVGYEHGRSIEAITKALTEQHVITQVQADAVKAFGEQLKQGTDAAKANAKAIADGAAVLSGAKLQDELTRLSAELAAAGGASKISAFEFEALGKKLETALMQGGKLPATLGEIFAAYVRLHGLGPLVSNDIEKLIKTLQQVKLDEPFVTGAQRARDGISGLVEASNTGLAGIFKNLPPVKLALEDLADKAAKAGFKTKQSFIDDANAAQQLAKTMEKFPGLFSPAQIAAAWAAYEKAHKAQLADDGQNVVSWQEKLHVSLDAVAGYLGTMNQAWGQSAQSVSAAMKVMFPDENVITTKTQKFQAAFSAIGSIIQQYAGTTKAGAALAGMFSGASTGAGIGASIAGPAAPVGAAVGAAIGAVVGLYMGLAQHAADVRKANADASASILQMQHDLIKSAGSMQQVDAIGKVIGVDLAAAWGDRSQAGLAHFSGMLDDFKAKQQALFDEINTGSGIASQSLKDLIAVYDQAATGSDAKKTATDFFTAQLGGAASGLNALLGGLQASATAKAKAVVQSQLSAMQSLAVGSEGAVKDAYDKSISDLQTKLEQTVGVMSVTKTQAAGLGGAIVATFGEMIARGTSFRDALAAIQPSLDTLKGAMQSSGVEGGAAFAFLTKMSGLANDAITGPLVDAINGAGGALKGLHNSGLLNQEMFSGIAESATAAYQQILAQGGDGTAALASMQPTLQTIWKLQKDFGYTVDDATAALEKQAIASGLVGEQAQTDAEKQTQAMQDVAAAMKELLGYFQRLLPAVKDTATAIGSIPSSLPDPYANWRVPGAPALPEGADVGSNGPPGFAGGTNGRYLDFGRGTLAVLHGREKVTREGEPDYAMAGGGGETHIHLNIDGREAARAVVPHIPAVVKKYGLHR